jgi:hypothetical protein
MAKIGNIADGSGTPLGQAVAIATRERKRKKEIEERVGFKPQPPKAFYCDQCELFYFEIDWFTREKRHGKCPVHDIKPKRVKK